MQSLRTQRPSDMGSSAPIPRQKLAKNQNRDARKSRVDDKLKKRMSMRYADISAPTFASGSIPALPGISERVPVGPRRTREEELYDEVYGTRQDEEDAVELDLEMLAKPDFDPDGYLKLKLANSSEAELKSLRSSLETAKANTATDLQKNVFKNYAEFVLISKEVSTLENELLELKESLAEWKNMPSLLNIDEGSSSNVSADRRRGANRNSVADLRTLYATQLSELHTQIEGSSKFVPAIPGRHIVAEFSDLWALNSATYKVEYAVHMVLLDDSLLIAKKRKKRSGPGGKLVAERCWPLGDIAISDMKDTVELTNVFKIRRSKEAYVFRTDRPSDKRSLLSTFRQTSEELSTKKRKERESEHDKRRSLWTGERNSVFGGVEPVPALPAWLADLQNSGLQVGPSREEQDARWVSDFTDNLAVAIAMHQWDEAVRLVEEGEMIKTQPTLGLLEPKLHPLKQSLISDLLFALSDPNNRRTAVLNLTSYLIRLGARIPARDAYLSMRSELMRKRSRMIRFEGNISLYISELALLTFTGIKHTSEWYLASFKDYDMASGMVQWGKEQIEIYAKTFCKQVYGPEVDIKIQQECVQVTRLQSKRLLQDNGLDYSFILDDLLAPSNGKITPSINDLSTRSPRSPIRRNGSFMGDGSTSATESESGRSKPRRGGRMPIQTPSRSNASSPGMLSSSLPRQSPAPPLPSELPGTPSRKPSTAKLGPYSAGMGIPRSTTASPAPSQPSSYVSRNPQLSNGVTSGRSSPAPMLPTRSRDRPPSTGSGMQTPSGMRLRDREGMI
ncbi:exocyst complex component exo84 [Tulasnella sp. 419]|nr:exocyst complex component exo84 [Tulasnella sp. 419]